MAETSVGTREVSAFSGVAERSTLEALSEVGRPLIDNHPVHCSYSSFNSDKLGLQRK